MRISDWSSDVCSSDLPHHLAVAGGAAPGGRVDPHHGLRGGVLEHLRSQPHRGQPRDPAAGLPRRARLAETAHRAALHPRPEAAALARSEEHTSELQSLMRISYAVFCLKKKKKQSKDTLAENQTMYKTHKK